MCSYKPQIICSFLVNTEENSPERRKKERIVNVDIKRNARI